MKLRVVGPEEATRKGFGGAGFRVEQGRGLESQGQ